ncbi:MAG: hypothetical protein ACXAC7_23990 [Candidatus Hodarchaeales archaeon]|jgi:hypothetical protein
MKKILAILIVGIFVVSIPAASSLMLPRIARRNITTTPVQTTDVPEWADGNISGVYAIKNETGQYEILGNLFGYYDLWWGNSSGSFEGTWETLNGSQSGQFAGWFFYQIALGYYNVTGSEESGGFISLIRINETDMSIQAVALVSNEDDYSINYALCSFTKFE